MQDSTMQPNTTKDAPAASAQNAAGAGENGELLRPAATCPRCGSRPALRLTEPLVAAVAGQPAARRLATYQCQRRGCGAVYDLAAEAFRAAR